MGMKAPVLPMMIFATALGAPAHAAVDAALGQARGAAADPANFDGARTRPETDLVKAGSPADHRTAGQIARDEQLKADARMPSSLALGEDKELEPPKPNEWLKSDHIISGVKGALLGLLIGSLWGMAGLGIGALIGGLIGYGLSRFTA